MSETPADYQKPHHYAFTCVVCPKAKPCVGMCEKGVPVYPEQPATAAPVAAVGAK